MDEGAVLPDRIRELATCSAAAALIVEQLEIRVAGVTSVRTYDTLMTGSYLFGKFVAKHGRVDASTFEGFYIELESSKLALGSKSGYWGCAKSLTRSAMARGKLPKFRIPHRYSAAQVKAAKAPPAIISSGLAAGVTGVDDGYLLQEVIGWAYGQLDRWDRLREIATEIRIASRGAFNSAEAQAKLGHKRISIQQNWIDDFVEQRKDDLCNLGIPTGRETLSALAFCLSFANDHLSGVPLPRSKVNTRSRPAGLSRVYSHRIDHVGTHAPGLLPAMMVPGHEQAAALAILLAASHVNSESILKIKRTALQPSQQPGVSILSWNKPRAHGEVPGIGLKADAGKQDEAKKATDPEHCECRTFSNRGGRAPTWSIVSAFNRYREGSEPLRRRLPDKSADTSLLLLAQPRQTHPAKYPEVISRKGFTRAIKAAAARCAADLARSDPRFAGLAFTLTAVRNSAIQDHSRRSGDLTVTRKVTQHRKHATTAIYVNNPLLRAASTGRTRSIQDQIVDAVRSRALVVHASQAPADLEQIGHGVGCRDRLAGAGPGGRAGRACEAFLCCIACSNGIVLATPLSYALLWRLRAHLQAPNDRKLREPERYDRWVRPAIELVTRALSEFPPEVAVEGTALGTRLQVDFGGIW